MEKRKTEKKKRRRRKHTQSVCVSAFVLYCMLLLFTSVCELWCEHTNDAVCRLLMCVMG